MCVCVLLGFFPEFLVNLLHEPLASMVHDYVIYDKNFSSIAYILTCKVMPLQGRKIKCVHNNPFLI